MKLIDGRERNGRTCTRCTGFEYEARHQNRIELLAIIRLESRKYEIASTTRVLGVRKVHRRYVTFSRRFNRFDCLSKQEMPGEDVVVSTLIRLDDVTTRCKIFRAARCFLVNRSCNRSDVFRLSFVHIINIDETH